MQPGTGNPAGRGENAVHQVRRRLDFFERLEPLLTGHRVGEQRPADRADARVRFEAFVLPLPGRAAQFAVDGFAEQGFELAALDPVFGFAWHHITCLYVR